MKALYSDLNPLSPNLESPKAREAKNDTFLKTFTTSVDIGLVGRGKKVNIYIPAGFTCVFTRRKDVTFQAGCTHTSRDIDTRSSHSVYSPKHSNVAEGC